MLVRVGGLGGKDGHALRTEIAHGFRLGAVEITGADKAGAAGAQCHQQCHRLRLEMNAGPDRQAGERSSPRNSAAVAASSRQLRPTQSIREREEGWSIMRSWHRSVVFRSLTENGRLSMDIE